MTIAFYVWHDSFYVWHEPPTCNVTCAHRLVNDIRILCVLWLILCVTWLKLCVILLILHATQRILCVTCAHQLFNGIRILCVTWFYVRHESFFWVTTLISAIFNLFYEWNGTFYVWRARIDHILLIQFVLHKEWVIHITHSICDLTHSMCNVPAPTCQRYLHSMRDMTHFMLKITHPLRDITHFACDIARSMCDVRTPTCYNIFILCVTWFILCVHHIFLVILDNTSLLLSKKDNKKYKWTFLFHSFWKNTLSWSFF